MFQDVYVNRVLAFLSDFGLKDPYVGQVEAVLAAESRARVVNLMHNIPPQHVDLAAHIVDGTLGLVPAGSVILAVVDPGVGTDRRGLIVLRNGRWLVGPDNGLLTPPVENIQAWEINNSSVARSPATPTFHARDIFAPVSIRLLGHERPEWLGRKIPDPIRIARPSARLRNGVAEGRIIHVDTYGNLISNIPSALLADASNVHVALEAGHFSERIEGISTTYGHGTSLIAVIGSWNLLEVALPQGSAAESLGITVGTPITAHIGTP